MKQKRILVLEPYYGGSHKHFLEGLKSNIDAEFVFLTLPARKWKMRMMLSALWFVRRIEMLKQRYFDTILCSTFVDVAVFKALAQNIEGWNQDCLICTYFHENQFVYPNQKDESAIHQFTTINFNTSLLSDRIAFNSKYNYNTFFENSSRYLRKAADMDFKSVINEIKNKAVVLYPGMDLTGISNPGKIKPRLPTICWNHRWEHDKGPAEFFAALYELKKIRDFKLIVLGQSFKNVPDCFNEAKEKLSDNIIHFGYADTRDEYISLLAESDIVVSTAKHEFFGISIMEAIKAGCYPIVPNRLSYPELYDTAFLYEGSQLVGKLKVVIDAIQYGKPIKSIPQVDKFTWGNTKSLYKEWLGI